jgi:endonuclease/exonuclease/phosphatase family metal-dependent hydrolase
MMMRTYWMMVAMVAAAAAACDESDGASGACAGTGAGGLHADSAGNAGAPPGGRPSGHAGSAGSIDVGRTNGGDSHGGAPPDPSAGFAGTPAEGGDAGAPSWQLRALTYNSQLAPGFEPLSEERKPQIEAALAGAAKELDLLCVQEYWAGNDFDDLAGAVAPELAHAFRQAPRLGSGSCTESELGELGTCLATNCAEKSGPELIECAQAKCEGAIDHVSGGCLGCFLDHLGDQAFAACLEPKPSDPALFGGAFDVGLLSRYPLLKKAVLEYDAYFVRASALYAQVNVPGLGPVDTFCTHLGSSLGVIPYHGPHGSWDGEHSYQVAQLLAFISAQTDGSHPVLLLGDLNSGPASAGPPPISAELPLDYQLLLGSGLTSVVSSPQCTLCSDNVLRRGNPREIWLDHALARGFGGGAQAERALTETFTLGEAPASTQMNLSDHYGLRVELTRE